MLRNEKADVDVIRWLAENSNVVHESARTDQPWTHSDQQGSFETEELAEKRKRQRGAEVKQPRKRQQTQEEEERALKEKLAALEKQEDELLEKVYEKFAPVELEVRQHTERSHMLAKAARNGDAEIERRQMVHSLRRLLSNDERKREETEGLLRVLKEKIKPSTVMQMLLWALLQDDSFYQPPAEGPNSSSSIWPMICEVLELSKEQEIQLKELRPQARQLAVDLQNSQNNLEVALRTVQSRCSHVEKLKEEIFSQLTNKQLENLLIHTELSTKLCQARDKLIQSVSGVALYFSIPAGPKDFFPNDQPWPPPPS